jgi:nitrogen fixation protein NifU and related proteins
MDLSSVYTELVMQHNSSKKNKRLLDKADLKEKGHNPSCGDEIEVSIIFNGDTIKEIAFTGTGCAISQASTSIMCDLLTGKSKKEATTLIDIFLNMIKKEIEDDQQLEVLEDAIIFKNISNMPARVKCAVLAWHTLKECI